MKYENKLNLQIIQKKKITARQLLLLEEVVVNG